jgi:hypothetical protein
VIFWLGKDPSDVFFFFEGRIISLVAAWRLRFFGGGGRPAQCALSLTPPSAEAESYAGYRSALTLPRMLMSGRRAEKISKFHVCMRVREWVCCCFCMWKRGVVYVWQSAQNYNSKIKMSTNQHTHALAHLSWHTSSRSAIIDMCFQILQHPSIGCSGTWLQWKYSSVDV